MLVDVHGQELTERIGHECRKCMNGAVHILRWTETVVIATSIDQANGREIRAISVRKVCTFRAYDVYEQNHCESESNHLASAREAHGWSTARVY